MSKQSGKKRQTSTVKSHKGEPPKKKKKLQSSREPHEFTEDDVQRKEDISIEEPLDQEDDNASLLEADDDEGPTVADIISKTALSARKGTTHAQMDNTSLFGKISKNLNTLPKTPIKKTPSPVTPSEKNAWNAPSTPKTPSMSVTMRTLPSDPVARLRPLKQLIDDPLFIFSAYDDSIETEYDQESSGTEENSTKSGKKEPIDTAGERLYLTPLIVAKAVCDLRDLRAVALGEILPHFSTIWDYYLERVMREDSLIKTVHIGDLKDLFQECYEKDIYNKGTSSMPIPELENGGIARNELVRLKRTAIKWFSRHAENKIRDYDPSISHVKLANIYTNSIHWAFNGGCAWLYRMIISLLLNFGQRGNISQYNPFKFSVDLSKGTPEELCDCSDPITIPPKFSSLAKSKDSERRAIVFADRYLNIVTRSSLPFEYATLSACPLSDIDDTIHNICIQDFSVLLESDRFGLMCTFIANNFSKRQRNEPQDYVLKGEMYKVLDAYLSDMHLSPTTPDERKRLAVFQKNNRYTATAGYWNLIPNSESLAESYLNDVRIETSRSSVKRSKKKSSSSSRTVTTREWCKALLQSEEAHNDLRMCFDNMLNSLANSYPNSVRIGSFVSKYRKTLNEHWFPQQVRALRKNSFKNIRNDHTSDISNDHVEVDDDMSENLSDNSRLDDSEHDDVLDDEEEDTKENCDEEEYEDNSSSARDAWRLEQLENLSETLPVAPKSTTRKRITKT